MWKKATIGGLAATALLAGGAGVAIAHAEGNNAPSAATATPTATATGTATPGASGAKTKGGKHADGTKAKEILGNLKNLQHAEWVTKGDANAYVTHEAILGQVTDVSSSSITVKSADGTSMTFAVTAQTAVHQRAARGATATPPAPTAPTIADVKTGQTVLVGGEKSPDLTAKNVLVRAA